MELIEKRRIFLGNECFRNDTTSQKKSAILKKCWRSKLRLSALITEPKTECHCKLRPNYRDLKVLLFVQKSQIYPIEGH